MSKRNNNQQKILLIEDEGLLSEMYCSKLSKEGFKVSQAANGEEGLELAKKEKFDLILLDIILPKLDGFKVLEELKRDKTIKEIPVFLLTNLSQSEDLKRGTVLGADDYLVKTDFTPTQVVEKIKKVLAK